jgi:transposase-like protein
MAQGRRTRAQWRQLVEGFSGSGLTQACYCERHGISVTSFHRWRAQFRQAPVANPRQAEASARRSAPVRLLPVQLLGEAVAVGAEHALTLVFASGVHVQVNPGFDAATLARVVRLLQEGTAA